MRDPLSPPRIRLLIVRPNRAGKKSSECKEEWNAFESLFLLRSLSILVQSNPLSFFNWSSALGICDRD